MTLMGLVEGFHGLLVARLFLGMTEAGLAPGIFYYLTMWYPRYEVLCSFHYDLEIELMTSTGANEKCSVLQRGLRRWSFLRLVGLCHQLHGRRWWVVTIPKL